MSDLVWLAAGILATYRLAQVVAQDVISEPLRAWISKRGASPEQLSFIRRWLAYGVHCVVCVSVWIGIGLATLRFGVDVNSVLFGFAFSGGAVALGSWLAAQNGRSSK